MSRFAPYRLLLMLAVPVALQAQSPVRGTVSDAESGAPVANAWVRAGMDRAVSVHTDSAGRFEVHAVAAPVEITVTAPGYEVFVERWETFPDSPVTVNLSAEPFPLQEVVVTATRIPLNPMLSPSPVYVITEAQIKQRAAGTLGASLSGLPGVFVRAYGGPNSVQTVSLRGTYSEHTLVLIDGQRFNSFQNSQTDFGIFPVWDIERIEIVKGGQSAVYGADAIGGVVNVITRRPGEQMRAGVEVAAGSDGAEAHGLSVGGRIAGVGWHGTFRRERGRGDYEFLYEDGPEVQLLRRNGADFRILSTAGRVEYSITPDIHSRFSFALTEAARGTPGALTHPRSTSLARLDDRIARSQLGIEWTLSPVVTGKLGGSFTASDQAYRDPRIEIQGEDLRSSHRNRAFVLTPEAHLKFSARTSAVAGAEVAGGWLSSSEAGRTERWQRSAFVALQHSLALPLQMPYEVVIHPSVRYDAFSDVGSDVSPRFGLNVGLTRAPVLRFRTSYGENFRVPTFNELYWKPGGNPGLSPERSRSFDAGLTSLVKLAGTLSVDLTYFSITTRERILWRPAPGGIWSPSNVASVVSRGLELDVTWSGWEDRLTLGAGAFWNRATKQNEDYPGDPTTGKQITHAPEVTANLCAGLNAGALSVFIRYSWVGKRFTTEANDRFLPPHGLASASARYTMTLGSIRAFLAVSGLNLLNTSYQVYPLYPMPLREFRTTVGAEL